MRRHTFAVPIPRHNICAFDSSKCERSRYTSDANMCSAAWLPSSLPLSMLAERTCIRHTFTQSRTHTCATKPQTKRRKNSLIEEFLNNFFLIFLSPCVWFYSQRVLFIFWCVLSMLLYIAGSFRSSNFDGIAIVHNIRHSAFTAVVPHKRPQLHTHILVTWNCVSFVWLLFYFFSLVSFWPTELVVGYCHIVVVAAANRSLYAWICFFSSFFSFRILSFFESYQAQACVWCAANVVGVVVLVYVLLPSSCRRFWNWCLRSMHAVINCWDHITDVLKFIEIIFLFYFIFVVVNWVAERVKKKWAEKTHRLPTEQTKCVLDSVNFRVTFNSCLK